MRYFGTDGIRGKVNTRLTVDIALRVGKALKCLNVGKIILGYDTRESNIMISSAIISGAMSVGIDVINVGVASTPSIIYYSAINSICGVIVTASHNLYLDNGIKIINNGKKLSSLLEEKIEEIIDNDFYDYSGYGRELKVYDFKYAYLSFLSRFIVRHNFKLGIDCSNGSTIEFAKAIFKDAYFIGCSDNGKNINKMCGSTNINHLREYVLKNNLDYGFSFDGDGDRVIMTDYQGNIYDGDDIIYLLALYLKETNRLNNNTIVLTIMSNYAVIKALKNQGIAAIEVGVGDKLVFNACKDNQLSLGGEASGHILLADLINCGDGILVGLWVIMALNYFDKPMKEIIDYVKYPQLELKIPLEEVTKTEEEIRTYLSIIKKEFIGKLVVRRSGTEEVIRVLISSISDEIIAEIATSLVDYLRGKNE